MGKRGRVQVVTVDVSDTTDEGGRRNSRGSTAGGRRQRRRVRRGPSRQPECFWCVARVAPGTDPADGRCESCRTKYGSFETADVTLCLDDCHRVFVRSEVAGPVPWRLRQLSLLEQPPG